MLNKVKDSGFTIVELLIVIVVIAILAAISIVAYNGIQTRAKTSAGQELASQIVKKVEAINAIKGAYPTGALPGATINTSANTAPTVAEAVIDTPSSVLGGTGAAAANLTSGTAANGTVVSAWGCTAGANVWYFNYDTNAAVPMKAGAGC